MKSIAKAALLAALALPIGASAQISPDTERVLEMLKRMDERREARARPEEAQGVARVERDIAYGPKPNQHFDVFFPMSPRGAAIFIAADSGWTPSDERRGLQASAGRFLAKGYTVIIARRRLWPEADPIAQSLDLARALAAAQAKAAAWGVSPERFALIGSGAGAHALALLAAEPNVALDLGAKPWAASILLDPPAYDIAEAMARSPAPDLTLAFGENPDFWERASPARRLSPSSSSLLAVCSAPRPGACEQARAFTDRARRGRPHAEMAPIGARGDRLSAELARPGALSERVDAFLRSVGLP